jgi:spermidine synthase
VRLCLSFAILIIPATAMGATLPIMVKAVLRINSNFGWALGRLYGWNTLGAVCGALAGETFLIKSLGITATGLAAAFLNFIAVFIAVRISSSRGDLESSVFFTPDAAGVVGLGHAIYDVGTCGS